MAEAVTVALFDRFAEANGAVDEIIQNGTPKDRIAVLANNSAGDHPVPATNPSFDRPPIEEESDASSALGAGVGIGGGLGGAIAVLVSAGLIAVPGIGPLLALGALASIAAGIGVGAVAGGIVGALIDHGVSSQDAELYSEGLRRGGTLVTVHAPSDQLESIGQVFKKHGAVDIERRAASWRAEGWVGFDREAHPLSAAEVAALREAQRAAGHQAHHHRAIRHYFIRSEPDRLAGISNETTHYGEDKLEG